MALIVNCLVTGEELDEPGAIIISPPDDLGYCQKFHISAKAFPGLVDLMNMLREHDDG